jgi:cbb3-type cytochrome oxidase subunit 3
VKFYALNKKKKKPVAKERRGLIDKHQDNLTVSGTKTL